MNIRLAPEGLPYIAALAGLGILSAFLYWPAAVVFLAALLFTLYFFRDPDVRTEPKPGEILAPSYGTVVQVGEEEEPNFIRQKATRIGIFLSVFDVHVNYAPVGGRVIHRQYQPGRFYNALKAKAADANECNWVGIEGREGRLLMKQIAGMIARRIVCALRPGEELRAGQRIGIIRFGSRVDVWLPPGCRALVKKGDRVRGGVTVIGVCNKK